MTDASADTTRRKPGKGPRPRHVPVRTCVVCREQDAKRGLIRIVRTPEGAIHLDPTGRANGRGAYLCHKPSCWAKAAQGEILARALNIEFPASVREELREYAVEHIDSGDDVARNGE
jgi:uncharacterized protein